ncbi:hypothetical protein C7457_1149 [Thermovibrio guaymasensis]|uniref:Glycerophosphoryl diester phosphodiesterase family protein n=1 Tax=Thermovibrio guaymasensis TaxID=240167 RepID=A0A420W6Q5_9BACT|nr:hypothetical protein [Thermovibrio guaymasensis]RKQ61707.1 hypothetical protein C7457_1149 [Thermovibrio guaymasensis]
MEFLSLILDYSFQSLVKNWKAVAIYTLFLISLTLLSFFHPVSIISNFLLQLLGIQIMVYYGTPILKGFSKDELYSFIESSTVKKVFTERFETSAGIFLSSFIMNSLLVVFLLIVIVLSGIPIGSVENLSEIQLVNLLLKLFFVFMLVILVISWYLYLYPLAFGYAMNKESFGEAFLSFFKMLSPSLWKRTLSLKYFTFIAVSGLLGTIFLLVGLVLTVSIVFIPVGAPFLYFANVFFGGVAAKAYLIAFKGELQNQS